MRGSEMKDLRYFHNTPKEDLDLSKILILLDEACKDLDDEAFVDRPLAYLKGILELGEAYRQELYGVRVVGLSKFVAGDAVVDTFTGMRFTVTTAQVELNDGEYKWMYRRGIYWIPETDLEGA